MAYIKKKIENLKPGKEYLIAVKAKNLDLNIDSNLTHAVRFQVPKDTTTPGPVGDLVLASNFQKVMFNFTANADIDLKTYEYELYDDSATPSLISSGYVAANVFTVDVPNSSKVENLSGSPATPNGTFSNINKVYHGRVRVIDTSDNASAWSNTAYTGNLPLITAEYIDTLTASKITAGTIGAQTIQLNGANSIIKSSNYVSGSSGWNINGLGQAEFNNITARGSVSASDFNLLTNTNPSKVIGSWGPAKFDSYSGSNFTFAEALKFNHLDSKFLDSFIGWSYIGDGRVGIIDNQKLFIVGPSLTDSAATPSFVGTTYPSSIRFDKTANNSSVDGTTYFDGPSVTWNDGINEYYDFANIALNTAIGNGLIQGTGTGSVSIQAGETAISNYGLIARLDIGINPTSPFSISSADPQIYGNITNLSGNDNRMLFTAANVNGYSGPKLYIDNYNSIVAGYSGIMIGQWPNYSYDPNSYQLYGLFPSTTNINGAYPYIIMNRSQPGQSGHTYISTTSTTGTIYLRPGNNDSTKQVYLTSAGALNLDNVSIGALNGNLTINGGSSGITALASGGFQLATSSTGYLPLYWGTGFANVVRLSSSKNLKENITTFENSGEIIDQLRPVSFVSKAQGDETEEEKFIRLSDIQHGFIAEEVALIDEGKWAAFDFSNGEKKPMNWRSPDIISLAIAELKSLRQRVKLLENQLNI